MASGAGDVCPSIFVAKLDSEGDAGMTALWAGDTVVFQIPCAVGCKGEVAGTLGVGRDFQMMPVPHGRTTVGEDLDGEDECAFGMSVHVLCINIGTL